MSNTALVLEGGGMRGIFTAGVLDLFIDKGLTFDNVTGVSAGAGHAVSYLSGQRGRAFDVCAGYVSDKRYCSLQSLFKTGDLFGADFIYREIPEALNPYDYDAYLAQDCTFRAVITDCETGRPEYAVIRDVKTDMDYVRASASLPFVSRIDVDYKLPDVLALNVVSTKEQLILKCDRKYICIDSEGKVVSDKKKKLAEGQFLVQGMLEQTVATYGQQN